MVEICLLFVDLLYRKVMDWVDVSKELARTFAPALKTGLISVGKRALQTGTEVLNDYVQGGDLKTSLKRRAKQNVNDMIRSAISNKSVNTKSTSVSRSKAVKKRRRNNKRKLDILDLT